MAAAVQSKPGSSLAWGPLTALGATVAGLTLALDQAAKFTMLSGLDLRAGPIALTRFAELVLNWNRGISYGLFQQTGPVGVWALFAFKVAAVAFLWMWLARVTQRLTAASLGLIIGGALGNAVDLLHWPGVLDFVFLHLETARIDFRWYVFNLADVAICAGVVGLLSESLRHGSAAKVP